MDPLLVDRIYECAFAPERWPGVLDELAQIADARGGLLFTATTKVLNWAASAKVHDGTARFVNSDLLTRGHRVGRLCQARHAGFLTEPDLYTEEQLGADPFYRDFLWPAGLGWAAGTAIPLPSDVTLIFTVERDKIRGPVEPAIVEQLDALRPHLARSALMSARLQMERARVASETLALIGLPALVVDLSGTVLAANHLIEALTDHIRWRAQDRVSLKDSRADALFHQATATLGATNVRAARSFAIRGADTDVIMVAHVIPIRGPARDIFVRCAGVLVMTPMAMPQAPPVELVQSLFDLSPAEAQVARSLAAGEAIENIATTRGVSRNTVRTQVQCVMDKTGCRRQAEVVALLSSVKLQRA